MRQFALSGSVAAVVGLAGCASVPSPSGPVVSPTGIVYEPGIPPSPTRASQTAMLYLRQGRLDRALELAFEGIGADADNPIHYFLAGVASARLGVLQQADSMFDRAQSIYPAYELDIEPEREAAWGRAFNDGLQSYHEGDPERAATLWRGATAVFALREQAHRNLASLLAADGRYDEAIEVYRSARAGLDARFATRALDPEEIRSREESTRDIEERLSALLLFRERFAEAEPLLRRRLERDPASVQTRLDLARSLDALEQPTEASTLYATLLAEEELSETELVHLGSALFRSGRFADAADAFFRVTELQPSSRDAWFNYANALFAAEAWGPLSAAGARLVEVEPLGENALLITARAQLESGDRDAALEILDRADSAPVYLEELAMRAEGTETLIRGRVVGNAAEPGTPIPVRFTFIGDHGVRLGAETLTLVAPSTGERVDFQVSFGMRAAAYRYEVSR